MLHRSEIHALLPLALKCLGYAFILALFVFCCRMYQMRMLIRRAQRDHGVPMMPHSFLLGHLPVMAKLYMKHNMPQDLHGHWIFTIIQAEFPDITECGVIYLDPWPIGFPIMAVIHPGMISQFTTSPSLSKFYWQRDAEFRHFSGGVDLLTSEGQEWKEQRTMYNPGFSSMKIAAMAPWFLEEVLVFKDRLLKATDTQQTIKMGEYTLDLTVDVIVRATFNIRTRTQEQAAPGWLDVLQKQTKLLYFNLDLKKQLSPTVLYKHRKYNRILKDAIGSLIEDEYTKYTKSSYGPKTITSLAVKRFAEKGEPIPPRFLHKIVNNVKMILFAGHETTSTTIAMVYYVLSQHPEKLAALRAEHDLILGLDRTQAAEVIRADCTILNKLTYTNAVLKEVLRLYMPVGGSIRESNAPDFMLTHPETGALFPTYGFMIHAAAFTLGRDENYWYKPQEFIPERFITQDENDPLYPVKNAWQPFGRGPRACIGQEMVQFEVKLTLALTIRDFDIIPDYPEGAAEFQGQKAYQAAVSDCVPSARIKDDLPVKVIRRPA